MSELSDAINRLDQTRAAIVRLGQAPGEGWQSQYVDLRIKLEACLAEVCHQAERAGGGVQLAALAENAKARLARHQARWPVIIIKGQDDQYAASIRSLEEIFDQLTRAARQLG